MFGFSISSASVHLQGVLYNILSDVCTVVLVHLCLGLGFRNKMMSATLRWQQFMWLFPLVWWGGGGVLVVCRHSSLLPSFILGAVIHPCCRHSPLVPSLHSSLVPSFIPSAVTAFVLGAVIHPSRLAPTCQLL